MTFPRTGLMVLALTCTLVTAGCTAAPPTDLVTSPSPAEQGPAAVDDEPDLVVVRDFVSPVGEVTCTIELTVTVPTGASDELLAEVEAARQFLAAGEAEGTWDTVEVSLEDFEETDLAARRAQGVSDAELLTMLVQDRIRADLVASGVIDGALSTESYTSCE